MVLYTITLWEVPHSIIRIISFYVSVGKLRMIPVLLARLLSRAAQCCTVFIVYYDSVHFLFALRDQIVTNAVPARWLRYCADIHTAHITLMAEQCSTLVVHRCQAGAASKSDAVLHKESLWLLVYINIYTTPYIIAWWWVAVLHLMLSIQTTCGSTLRCHFLTRSFSASGRCYEAYMLQLLNIT